MSAYWEQQVWDSDALSGLDKFVVLAMARAAGEDGLAFLSVKSLAALTGVGVTKAGLALKVAEDRGVLVRATDEETVRVGPIRAVVYRFSSALWSPSDGDHSPRGGDHSPRDGYMWQPDAAPGISASLRVAESSLRVAESSLRVAGTTSSSRDSESGSNFQREKQRPRSSSLVSYWKTEFLKAVRVNDLETVGALDERILGRNLKLLASRDGLTREQITAMIDAYMAQPSAWSTQTHPAMDMFWSGTLTRLRNQTKHRDEVGMKSLPPALTEVLDTRSVEEIMAEIKAEDEGRFQWATKTS